MIPAAFDYVRASSAAEAVSLLAAAPAGETMLLAGGHSLIPLLRRRLSTPRTLVDVSAIDALSYVEDAGAEVAIGAMTCYAALAGDPVLRAGVPLLAQVASTVGDPQVRQRGTIGGSLAHADPVADLPVALLALNARIAVRGPDGEREVPASAFFFVRGANGQRTAAGPAEMITEIRVPKLPDGAGHYAKFSRRVSDWGVVTVAAARDGGQTRVALGGMGRAPRRAAATEALLAAGGELSAAARVADEETEPPADLHASPAYRRHLARVLTERALTAIG